MLTLSTAQIPAHTHQIVDNTEGWVSASSGTAMSGYVVATTNSASYRRRIATVSGGGDGGSHQNMPPYQTAYYWKRTV